MLLPFTRYGASERALVLVHGWLSSAPIWNLILEGIDAGGRSVIIPDLRGAGLARTFPSPYDTQTAAEDLCDTLDACGIGQAVLAGHSMGAKIALELAATIPERVESVVAVAPVPPQGVSFDAKTLQMHRAALDDDEALAKLIGGFSAHRYPRGWVYAHAAMARAAMTREAGAQYLESFAAQNSGTENQKLKTPVLALCGAADTTMTTKFVSASLMPLCRALTVAEIPASSHYPMLEVPLLFAATLNAWVANKPLPHDIKVAVSEMT